MGFTRERPIRPRIYLGIDKARLPDGQIVRTVNRLAGPPTQWRSLEFKRRRSTNSRSSGRCVEPVSAMLLAAGGRRHRAVPHPHLRARKAILGQDLARSEKFTTSVMDGIDIRETLRNWHTGDIYVKNFPPTRGGLDAVVMLFDSPADPRDYPYRVTWHHEHDEESTLAFFATDFRKNVIGPGIGQATYGGTLMIFPPLHISDIWHDRAFDAADTMEERLLMAACTYSNERHIALLSGPPGRGLAAVAQQFGKKLVHLPLAGSAPAPCSNSASSTSSMARKFAATRRTLYARLEARSDAAAQRCPAGEDPRPHALNCDQSRRKRPGRPPGRIPASPLRAHPAAHGPPAE